MPLELVRNDITKMETDAIVNAANCELAQGGGVCGAIFAAAGAQRLAEACRQLGGCTTGEAVVTPGFDLPAKYIIHTPGPVWRGGMHGEEPLLRSCYTRSLERALDCGCRSVAFPLISAGIYGFPMAEALSVAVSAIGAFLLTHDDIQVYLTVYDDDAFMLGGKLFPAIRSYIDARYVGRRPSVYDRRSELLRAYQSAERDDGDRAAPAPASDDAFCACTVSIPGAGHVHARKLEDVVGEQKESFSLRVLRLIDERGLSDVTVYKRANLDRKLFSKLRSDPDYRPSRMTAIALAVALELNLDETRDLLKKAGYALSDSSKFDLIVQYFIEEQRYNIFEINEALFTFGQNLLGA